MSVMKFYVTDGEL